MNWIRWSIIAIAVIFLAGCSREDRQITQILPRSTPGPLVVLKTSDGAAKGILYYKENAKTNIPAQNIFLYDPRNGETRVYAELRGTPLFVHANKVYFDPWDVTKAEDHAMRFSVVDGAIETFQEPYLGGYSSLIQYFGATAYRDGFLFYNKPVGDVSGLHSTETHLYDFWKQKDIPVPQELDLDGAIFEGYVPETNTMQLMRIYEKHGDPVMAERFRLQLDNFKRTVVEQTPINNANACEYSIISKLESSGAIDDIKEHCMKERESKQFTSFIAHRTFGEEETCLQYVIHYTPTPVKSWEQQKIEIIGQDKKVREVEGTYIGCIE